MALPSVTCRTPVSRCSPITSGTSCIRRAHCCQNMGQSLLVGIRHHTRTVLDISQIGVGDTGVSIRDSVRLSYFPGLRKLVGTLIAAVLPLSYLGTPNFKAQCTRREFATISRLNMFPALLSLTLPALSCLCVSAQDTLKATIAGPTLSINRIPFSTRAFWMRRANDALAPCTFGAFASVVVNHTAPGLGELVCTGVNSRQQTGDPILHGTYSRAPCNLAKVAL